MFGDCTKMCKYRQIKYRWQHQIMQNGCGGCQLRIWRKQAVERTTKNVQRVTAPDCKKNTGNRKSEILASAHKISNAWPWPACATLGRGPTASVGLGFGRAISSPHQHHVMLRLIILVLMERQIASGCTICLKRLFDRVPLRSEKFAKCEFDR